MNDRHTLAASVQPIRTTEASDVMIQTSDGASALVIGLRDDGKAALSIQASNGEATRTGDCHGYAGHLQRWLNP